MKDCDSLGGGQNTLTPPTYLQGSGPSQPPMIYASVLSAFWITALFCAIHQSVPLMLLQIIT